MVKVEEIQELDSMLKNASKITIVSHYNPDGDAVGSSMGAYHFIKNRGKNVNVVIPNVIADYLQFLNPSDAPILFYRENPELCRNTISDSDLIICLDLNGFNRTEFLEEILLQSTAKKVLIDHHLNPKREEFDFVISQTETSSASELLFWILMGMPEVSQDVQKLSIECATALYTGMMTDTNNFNNSVLPSTFQMASMLIERGVNKMKVQETVLNCYSADRMRLMGHLLRNKMCYLPDLGSAYIMLTQREKSLFNFQNGDSEGFVNLPLSILGVNISALFSESYNGEQTYVKVSLRSKGDYDVNMFARKYFNGGGHKNASGGKLFMPLRKVPKYFESVLKEYLQK